MFDIGDTVPLEFTVIDESGNPVDAAGVTLTIRLPDGTTVTPTPDHPGVGQYELGYVPAEAGRYHVRWTATGPEMAFTDAFNVATGTVGIISLNAAKKHLKIPLDDHKWDDELRSLIGGITRVIESEVGAIDPVTVTETHSGGRYGREAIALDHGPVIEILEVTENGSIVDPSGYSMDDHGIVTRVSGYHPIGWMAGVNNIIFKIVVGRKIVGENLIEAAKELTRINFRPIAGGNYSPFDRQPDETITDERWRYGFFLPNGVLALLQGEMSNPGFA